MRGVVVSSGALALVVALIGALGITTAGERFPHGVHAEADLDCETCHNVAESRDLRVSLLPSPELCEDCHDRGDLETWGLAKIERAKPRFLSFSHKTHLDVKVSGETGCFVCHVAMGHPEKAAAVPAGAVSLAGHSLCSQCHDGGTANDACESCHSTPVDGAPAGTWWGLALQESSPHGPGFLHRHQFAAQTDGPECASCHDQDLMCSTCHHGENVDYAVHERVWLYTHPQEAIKHLQDCQSCHEMDGFCTDCHAAEGIRPGNHAMAGWIGGLNLHGPAAHRDLTYCAGCHESDASTCGSSTGCHRDDNIQGNQRDRNLHPAGFRDDAGHGPWHEDDGSSCFECHDVTSRTTGIGFCTYCHAMK
jgi:hypothetical protein